MIHYMNQAGSYHREHNIENQDAVTYQEKNQFTVLVLADGASSCRQSAEGAEIVCRTLTEILLSHAERFFSLSSTEAVSCLIASVLHEIRKKADAEQFSIEDYSSTASCILYDHDRKKIFYFSLGDSLIMAVRNHRCQVVAMPSDSRDGCCMMTTVNGGLMAKSGILSAEEITSVLLCSDGAWHLMYRRNRLYPEIRQLLINQNYDELKGILKQKDGFDDCSFISLCLPDFQKGTT